VNLFHFIKQKQTTNSIDGLKINGVIVRELNQMKQHVEEYYKTLLSGSDNNNRNDHNNTLDFITARVDDDFGNQLIRDITIEEIKKTLDSCSKKKSPGPDGLTYEFYSRNFDTIKEDLVALFNKFLENPNTIPKDFSKGANVLIPKKCNANEINNFRPISLLNCD
jgi:hypothetical protein